MPTIRKVSDFIHSRFSENSRCVQKFYFVLPYDKWYKNEKYVLIDQNCIRKSMQVAEVLLILGGIGGQVVLIEILIGEVGWGGEWKDCRKRIRYNFVSVEEINKCCSKSFGIFS